MCCRIQEEGIRTPLLSKLISLLGQMRLKSFIVECKESGIDEEIIEESCVVFKRRVSELLYPPKLVYHLDHSSNCFK